MASAAARITTGRLCEEAEVDRQLGRKRGGYFLGNRRAPRLTRLPPAFRARLQSIRYRMEREGYIRDEYSMVIRGGQVVLKADLLANKGGAGAAPRAGKAAGSVVSGFSKESRRALLDCMLGIDWDALAAAGKRPLWVALTYGNEFPHDGRVCKKHFDAWVKRMELRLGKLSAVWKREFQKRGAPHYHLVLVVPASAELGAVQDLIKETWTAIRGEWSGIVETEKEKQAAIQAEEVRKIQSLSQYCALYLGKDEQNELPAFWSDVRRGCSYDEPFINAGRYWGVLRKSGLPSCVKSFSISKEQFEAGEAAIRAAWKAAGLPDYDMVAKIVYRDFKPGAVDAVIRAVHAEM